METVIYGLYCPIACAIRYIGKSIYPEQRFKAHLYLASRLGATHKQRWIASVLEQGLKPELRILERIPDGHCWASVERRWIAEAMSNGWPLTNHAAGGEGSSPLNEDAKARRKLQMSKPSTRAKMSASAKARWADPEKRAIGLSGLRSEVRRKRSSVSAIARATPEYRAMMSGKSKAAWRDPAKKSNIIAGITPETRAKISKAAKRMWETSEKSAVMLANLRSRGS